MEVCPICLPERVQQEGMRPTAPSTTSVDLANPASVPASSATSAPPSSLLNGAVGLVGWATLAGGLTLLNRFARYGLSLPPVESFAGNLLGAVYLCALLFALLQVARSAAQLPLSTPFLVLAGSVLSLPSLAVLAATLLRVDIPVLTLFYAVIGPVMQSFVNNFLGPIGLSFLGAAFGRVIKHPNTLLAGAGFAIFFDIVVVTMGTVAQLMKSGSNLIAAVSVGAGAQPTNIPGTVQVRVPDPLSSVTIGPADVLFLALFFGAVWHLRLSVRSTFAWMFVLLSLALIQVETLGLPIPALAPMGVAVLIANARYGAFTQTEKRDLAIGSVFAVFCAVLIVVISRNSFKPAPPQGPPPRIGIAFARHPQGLRITEVAPNSPAKRAGVRKGDVLVGVNDVPVSRLTREVFDEKRRQAQTIGMLLRVLRTGQKEPIDVKIPPLESYGPTPQTRP